MKYNILLRNEMVHLKVCTILVIIELLESETARATRQHVWSGSSLLNWIFRPIYPTPSNLIVFLGRQQLERSRQWDKFDSAGRRCPAWSRNLEFAVGGAEPEVGYRGSAICIFPGRTGR